MTHHYFTLENARDLIGARVRARVALSRRWLRDLGLWVVAGSMGTVTQFTFGPSPGDFVVGVRWDDIRPAIPRLDVCPIDWYAEHDFRALLEIRAAEVGRDLFGCVIMNPYSGRPYGYVIDDGDRDRQCLEVASPFRHA